MALPEQIAQSFHETYERLAPDFGYRTRRASAVPWQEVPEANRELMVAVVRELMRNATIQPGPRLQRPLLDEAQAAVEGRG